jgi:hypothetical protein
MDGGYVYLKRFESLLYVYLLQQHRTRSLVIFFYCSINRRIAHRSLGISSNGSLDNTLYIPQPIHNRNMSLCL